MIAHVDESGNTGRNLFDPAQPLFVSSVMLTRTDFHAENRDDIANLLRDQGIGDLHAKELGQHVIERLAGPLDAILTRAGAKFGVAVIDKKYLALSKLFDTLFDAGENLAVPNHVYWMRPLRLLLLLRVAMVVDEDVVADFWNGMVSEKPTEARIAFLQALERLENQLAGMKDDRSRSIAISAVSWARKFPDQITYHVEAKIARHGHMPNLAAFGTILETIEEWSETWNMPVKAVIHDRQSEFELAMREWHGLFAGASKEMIRLPGGDTYKLARAAGSQLSFLPSDDNHGIQVVDVVLWILQRRLKGLALGPHSERLLANALADARIKEFSFEAIEKEVEGTFSALFSIPMTDAQLEKARHELEEAESRRAEREQEFYARRFRR